MNSGVGFTSLVGFDLVYLCVLGFVQINRCDFCMGSEGEEVVRKEKKDVETTRELWYNSCVQNNCTRWSIFLVMSVVCTSEKENLALKTTA